MKLFRIDIGFDYLFATDNNTYTPQDVLNWIKNEIHLGELERPGTLTIQRVINENQIVDYDDDYNVYHNLPTTVDISLKEIKNEINKPTQNIEKLIEVVKRHGYTVTKT